MRLDSGFQGFLQITQPVTASANVEDIGSVQEPIQDGGGKDFVAGEQFGPVTGVVSLSVSAVGGPFVPGCSGDGFLVDRD